MRGHVTKAACLFLLLFCPAPYARGGATPTDIESLIQMVRDTTDRGGLLRAKAAKALGELGDRRAVDALLEALADPSLRNPFAKEAVCAAIGAIGDPNAVEPLIAFIEEHRDEQMVITGAALKALGEFADARAIDVLATCAADRSCLVRDVALEVLGKIDDPRATEILARYANGRGKDARTGQVARNALERKRLEADIYGLVDSLKGGTALQRAAAWEKLIKSGALAVGPLYDLLNELNKDAERAERPDRLESDFDVQSPFELRPIEPLRAAPGTERTDDIHRKRLEARRRELLQEGKPLLDRLKRVESNIRYPRRFGRQDALTTLKEREQLVMRLQRINAELWRVRLDLADTHARARGRSMGYTGYLQSEEETLSPKRREDYALQCRVIEVLSELGDPYAVEPVAHALGRHDEQVRIVARQALIQFGPVAVPVLLEVLQWNAYDPLFAEALIATMVDMGPTITEPLIAALASEGPVPEELPSIIGRIGDRQALGPLVMFLSHGNSEVIGRAARTLAELGDPCAVGPLIACLDRYGDYPCASQVTAALGQMGDRRATEALVKHLKRYQGGAKPPFTVEALRRLGDPCAVEAFKSCLDAPESAAALAAGCALLELTGAEAVPAVSPIVGHQPLNRELIRLLLKNGWEPVDAREQVYSWIALDHTDMMLGHWDRTRAVLLADLSQDPASLGYEPSEVLLALRKDDSVVIRALLDHLVKTELELVALRRKTFGLPVTPAALGRVRSLAERYIDSGHPVLWQAGLQWLGNHDVPIVVMVPGKMDWQKVSFDEVFGKTGQWQ